MLHPNLEIRGRPSHPDPYIREDGGKGWPPQIFSALQALVWSKNKGGPGPPGPSSGSTTAVEEPFQVIYRTLFLTTILFLDLLWVHLFIPPPLPHPPPTPDNVVTSNGLISTHCAQNSTFLGVGAHRRGEVASFTNITGKVPKCLTSIVSDAILSSSSSWQKCSQI